MWIKFIFRINYHVQKQLKEVLFHILLSCIKGLKGRSSGRTATLEVQK